MVVSRQIRELPKLEDIFANVPRAKRICIDIDGVICEYDFPNIVKNFFGIDLSAKMIFAYDLADVLGVAPALINTMFKEQVYGKPNFVEGAIDTLRKWREEGHRIDVYSNRVKYMGATGLAEWLWAYDIPFYSISDGSGVFDCHIDDSPAKLMGTNSKLKLLYDRPWNKRCLNITGGLERVYDWGEIRQRVS